MGSRLLNITTGQGITSCLSVRLSDTLEYYDKYGVWPDVIDSTMQFSPYKRFPDEDVSSTIFGDYRPDVFGPYLKYVYYNHDQKYMSGIVCHRRSEL